MARSRPLADFIAPCLGPALAAQGFAASDVVMAWPEIVGERLARDTQPIRIEWPRGRTPAASERPEPATLVVRVTGVFALELQHITPVVIDRVNTHFGWRCIGRLSLRQGPVRRRAAAERKPAAPDAAGQTRVDETVAAVDDEGLRRALARLGEAVVGASQGRDPTAT